MQNDVLNKVVVDLEKRKFYLYSNEGNERVVECETTEEFMNVLKLCREMLDEDTIKYVTL